MVTETKKPGFREKTWFLDSRAVMRRWIPTVTLLFLALLTAAPLWGPGIVNTRGGGDSPFLLQRTHQMLVNLRAGVFPARWMPDAAYGLGYPFFSYYAALPYYLAGLLALVGLDLLTAVKLVQTLGFVAAALAMYGWMRGVSRSRWAAWLAAVAYTAAPFHLVNVYVRGDSLSEFYAFIFYPLILWALDGITKSANQQIGKSQTANRKSQIANRHSLFAIRSSLFVAAAALAYAGLILTHNISAMIFSPFALLYLLILAGREKTRRWQVLGCGLGALGLGILLAAWFWVPAVVELRYVQLGPSTQDYFHYSNHFRTFNLVQRGLLFNFSVAPDLAGRSPFAMGLAQAVFAALGVLVLVVRAIRQQLDARWGFVLAGLLLSTAMITPLSRPLWEHLPLLPVVQFPWRFLSVQALFTAAATGHIANRQISGSQIAKSQIANRKSQTFDLHSPFSLIALPIATLLAISVLLPLRPDRLPIGPADVTVERMQLYELFAGNIGTTIRYEWLPRTANPRPFTSDALVEPNAPPRAIPLDGVALDAALVERKPTRQVWQVWGEGGSIAFPLLYWPGWKARVDGQPVDVWPVAGSGYLALQVPPGQHSVVLQLGRTPVRAAAEVVSLVAAVALLVAVVVHGRGKLQIANGKSANQQIGKSANQQIGKSANRQIGKSANQQIGKSASQQIGKSATGHLPFVHCSLSHCSLFIVSLFIVSLFIVSLFILLPHGDFEGNADLTMDFDQMPYLHHNPGGVDFGGKVQLAGYTLSAEELAPGDTLTVTLDWSDVDSVYTATMSLFSPAAVRYDVQPLAASSQSLTCNLQFAICNPPFAIRHSFVLQLPPDTPRSVYLLQLRLFGSDGELHARTTRGTTQGILYLRPVRVSRGTALPRETAVLAPFGPALRLHAVTAAQPAPDRLAVQLAWSATRPAAANYGISLRLVDADGQLRASLDTQPGYGFLPTSTWRPGELVADRYLLALPNDLPSGAGYRLMVVLYQISTLDPVAQAQVGDFALPLEIPFEAQPLPREFSLLPLENPLGIHFDGEIRLAGYDLEQGEDALRLTLWWQALVTPQADYTVFVHLFDSTTEVLVAQSDAQPRGGAYPTSWWVAGEVVSETITLPLEGVPQGTYQLAVGLYDRTVTRLPASGPDGGRLPDDRVILPESLEVKP